MLKITFVFYILFLSFVFAIDICRLSDPDITVNSLFPDSVGYIINYVSIDKTQNPLKLYSKFINEIGGKINHLIEGRKSLYAIYNIYGKDDLIGYILCVSQDYYGSIMEVVLSFNTKREINSMFYATPLKGKNASNYNNDAFLKNFIGLDYETLKKKKIPNPVLFENEIYDKSIRAVKKNLFIINEFTLTK
jgi:hypothetical protein